MEGIVWKRMSVKVNLNISARIERKKQRDTKVALGVGHQRLGETLVVRSQQHYNKEEGCVTNWNSRHDLNGWDDIHGNTSNLN